MKKNELLDSLELIDERLIEEAAYCYAVLPERKKKCMIKKIVVSAAALLILVPLLFAVALYRRAYQDAGLPNADKEYSMRGATSLPDNDKIGRTLISFTEQEKTSCIALIDAFPGFEARILFGMDKEEVLARLSAISPERITQPEENLISIKCEEGQDISSVDLLFEDSGFLRLVIYYAEEEITPEKFTQWLLPWGEGKNVEGTGFGHDGKTKGQYFLYCAESAEKLLEGDGTAADVPDDDIPFVYAEMIRSEALNEGKPVLAIGVSSLFCESAADWLEQKKLGLKTIQQQWDEYTPANLSAISLLGADENSKNAVEPEIQEEIFNIIAQAKDDPDVLEKKEVSDGAGLFPGIEEDPLLQADMSFERGDRLMLTVYPNGGFLSVIQIDEELSSAELTLVLSKTLLERLFALCQEKSNGTVEVPGVVGTDVNTSAIQRITAAGLQYKIFWIPSDFPELTVVSQSPVGGTLLEKDETVTLQVSSGPDTVPLETDSLTGLSLLDANRTLSAMSLYYEGPYYEESNSVPPGTVIRWEPANGDWQVKKGDTVKLFISNLASEKESSEEIESSFR